MSALNGFKETEQRQWRVVPGMLVRVNTLLADGCVHHVLDSPNGMTLKPPVFFERSDVAVVLAVNESSRPYCLIVFPGGLGWLPEYDLEEVTDDDDPRQRA